MKRLVVALISLIVSPLWAASSAPPSDPQATAFAAQSVAAMTGGGAVTDLVLTGNVTRIAGSDQQTGTATLMAKGYTESRVDLSLSGGSWSEIRNGSTGLNAGNWVGPDSVVHAIAQHNCLTDASWFFPALGSLASAATNPNVVLAYMGEENPPSGSFQHIQVYTSNSSWPGSQALSTMDFYLDAQTLLPIVIMFNEHPDDDQLVNIAVQVMFSDYRNVNGAQIPFHIQRYVNNSLTLDVQLTSASVNTGVSDNNFSLH